MRYYNRWAGNPKGIKEDISRCIAEVASDARSILTHQCLRKRGKGDQGLFCGIHAKMYKATEEFWCPKDE